MSENADDIQYMFACPTCEEVTQIETVATRWLNGKPVYWEHRCIECGTSCGFIADMGELDLGVVRDSARQLDFSDFEVFTEIPWEY